MAGCETGSAKMRVKMWCWILDFSQRKPPKQLLFSVLISQLSLHELFATENGFNPLKDNSLVLFSLNAIVPLAGKTAFNYISNRDNNKL